MNARVDMQMLLDSDARKFRCAAAASYMVGEQDKGAGDM